MGCVDLDSVGYGYLCSDTYKNSMRKISIAIPTFKRVEQTVYSFQQVLSDDRVSEVIIVDDASGDGSFAVLRNYFEHEPKVKVYENSFNLDCYMNKHRAMELATEDWAILFDSDNTLTKEYLDAIYSIPKWDAHTIYQPSFSKPHFDFRKWSGLVLTEKNVAQYADTHLMTALNACNFFINREEYLKVWDGNVNPGSSDSIYFSYCWLCTGREILITPDLEYDHFISPKKDGHYQLNSHLYVGFHDRLMQKIKSL